MQAAYSSIHQKAERLHSRTESMVDDRNDAAARQAMDMAEDVAEQIQSDRPPRSIEDGIRRLMQLLERLKAAPTAAMTPQDAGQLFNDYESLRRDVRALPNY